jgi:hypothetical protein
MEHLALVFTTPINPGKKNCGVFYTPGHRISPDCKKIIHQRKIKNTREGNQDFAKNKKITFRCIINKLWR